MRVGSLWEGWDDQRTGKESSDWRTLLGLPSRATFSKEIIIPSLFQSWNLGLKKEGLRQCHSHWICQKCLDHKIFSECWQSLLGNPTYTIAPKAARHTGMKCLSKVNKQFAFLWHILLTLNMKNLDNLPCYKNMCHSVDAATLCHPQNTATYWDTAPTRLHDGWTQHMALSFKCCLLLFPKVPHLSYGG